MNIIKKKTNQNFANGSLINTNAFFKQSNQVKISEKDHTTLNFYKKTSTKITDPKNFISFKTKYLRF